jgi:hypothetical protein
MAGPGNSAGIKENDGFRDGTLVVKCELQRGRG